MLLTVPPQIQINVHFPVEWTVQTHAGHKHIERTKKQSSQANYLVLMLIIRQYNV